MIRSTPKIGITGPWPCDQCGELSQYADVGPVINRIYCVNEACDFTRIVDKHYHRIVENDGTHWQYDGEGNKWRTAPV